MLSRNMDLDTPLEFLQRQEVWDCRFMWGRDAAVEWAKEGVRWWSIWANKPIPPCFTFDEESIG